MRTRHSMKKNADGTIDISVVDPLDKETNTVRVQSDEDYTRWVRGEHVQVAFPYLSEAEREILVTGFDAESWKKIMGNEE